MANDKSHVTPDIAELADNFDLHNADMNKCPFSVLSHMRSEAPVHHSDAYGGHWVLVGYDAVNDAVRGWKDFTSTQGVVITDLEARRFIPITYDPPQHTDFRKIMSTFFDKKVVQKYQEPLREYTDKLIDEFITKGNCDLIKDFAHPLCGHIFYTILFEFPPEQAEYCCKIVDDAMFSHDLDVRLAGFAAIGEFSLKIIRDRQGKTLDDSVIDGIRSAEIDGRELTEEESAGALQTLILGGFDTMVHALGNLFVQIGSNPILRDEVVFNRELLPAVVEESIRHTPAATSIARTVVDDIEFHGQQLRKGDRVLLLWLSANRDEKVFESPDTFDYTRKNLKKNIGFGMGPHRCIGEWLARIILNVAFEQILVRIPDFELDADANIEYRMGQSRGPVSVPVHFTASAVE